MKYFYSISAFIALLLLSSCSRMSDSLKDRLNNFLENAAALNAMTEQGVNYNDYSHQLALTKGSYDLALANWPDDLAVDARESFDLAFEGWEYAHYMWNLKIEDLGEPTEPDKNKYDEIVSFAGEENLFIKTTDTVFESSKGRKFLPFDENIGILLAIASDHFETGQSLILEEME